MTDHAQRAMMRDYETITASYIVLPKGEAIYSEQATTISLEDEAAGLFVKISQSGHIQKIGCVNIEVEEWPMVRDAIEQLLRTCKTRNAAQEVPCQSR